MLSNRGLLIILGVLLIALGVGAIVVYQLEERRQAEIQRLKLQLEQEQTKKWVLEEQKRIEEERSKQEALKVLAEEEKRKQEEARIKALQEEQRLAEMQRQAEEEKEKREARRREREEQEARGRQKAEEEQETTSKKAFNGNEPANKSNRSITLQRFHSQRQWQGGKTTEMMDNLERDLRKALKIPW